MYRYAGTTLQQVPYGPWYDDGCSCLSLALVITATAPHSPYVVVRHGTPDHYLCWPTAQMKYHS